MKRNSAIEEHNQTRRDDTLEDPNREREIERGREREVDGLRDRVMERSREVERSPSRFTEMERFRDVRPRTTKVKSDDVVRFMGGHLNKDDKNRMMEIMQLMADVGLVNVDLKTGLKMRYTTRESVRETQNLLKDAFINSPDKRTESPTTIKQFAQLLRESE